MRRFRFTVRLAMVAVLLMGCGIRAIQLVDFPHWSHHELHLAEQCGCEQAAITTAVQRHHIRLAKLYGFCAVLLGEPPERCGLPMPDVIREDISFRSPNDGGSIR